MHASERTRNFKILVIGELSLSRLGYDTRHHFYRRQYPDMDADDLAKRICDPIELYDKDWPACLSAQAAENHEEALAAFVLERDARFRAEAQVAIYCYDEAGFGSGLNSMRFIREGKPILGFYHADPVERSVNLTNVLQLELEFPGLVTLAHYRSLDEIPDKLTDWLRTIRRDRVT